MAVRYKEKHNRAIKKWQKKNKHKIKAYHKQRWLGFKVSVLTKYGGQCYCCGEDDIRFLTIGHKNDDGHEERKSNKGSSGNQLYLRLLNSPVRADLRVECWNCNCGRRKGEECPHRLIKVSILNMAKSTRSDTGYNKSRMYIIHRPDGTEVKYPSVTARLQLIAKPALIPWAKKCVTDYIFTRINDIRKAGSAEEIGDILAEARKADTAKRDKAADIGSLAHSECERFIRGQITVEQANPAVIHMVKALSDWCRQVDFKLFEAEDTVYSDIYQYAGTLDLVGYVNGKLAVIDLKTSSGIYPEMKIQIAAYANAFNEMHQSDEVLGKVEEGWVVKLAKDAKDPKPFETYRIDKDELELCFNAFIGVNQLGKFFDKINVPHNIKANKEPQVEKTTV